MIRLVAQVDRYRADSAVPPSSYPTYIDGGLIVQRGAREVRDRHAGDTRGRIPTESRPNLDRIPTLDRISGRNLGQSHGQTLRNEESRTNLVLPQVMDAWAKEYFLSGGSDAPPQANEWRASDSSRMIRDHRRRGSRPAEFCTRRRRVRRDRPPRRERAEHPHLLRGRRQHLPPLEQRVVDRYTGARSSSRL